MFVSLDKRLADFEADVAALWAEEGKIDWAGAGEGSGKTRR
jgi:hypothetical protein